MLPSWCICSQSHSFPALFLSSLSTTLLPLKLVSLLICAKHLFRLECAPSVIAAQSCYTEVFTVSELADKPAFVSSAECIILSLDDVWLGCYFSGIPWCAKVGVTNSAVVGLLNHVIILQVIVHNEGIRRLFWLEEVIDTFCHGYPDIELSLEVIRHSSQVCMWFCNCVNNPGWYPCLPMQCLLFLGSLVAIPFLLSSWCPYTCSHDVFKSL